MASGLTDIFVKQQSASTGRFPGAGMSNNGSVSDITFVTDSPFYKKVVQNVLNQTQIIIKSDKIDKKAREEVFPKVKAILIAKIGQMVTDPVARKNLTDKVTAIVYIGSNCSQEAGSNEGSVPGLLLANVFYHLIQNTFKYCSGLSTRNSSEFHMAFIIAHELSHSIDPCSIAIGPSDFIFRYSKNITREKAESEFPFEGLISCLRSEKSVQAISAEQMLMLGTVGSTTDPYGNNGGHGGGYGGGIGTATSSEPSVARPTPPFIGFCHNDQITETFADWMASEITPDYIKNNFPKLSSEQMRLGYSNIWRGACVDDAQQSKLPHDVHPSQKDRSNRIILTQPKIRAQMDCTKSLSDRVYCAVRTAADPQPSQQAPSKGVAQ